MGIPSFKHSTRAERGYMATAPVEEQMFMHGSMAIQTSERMAGFASPLDLTEMIEHFRSDLQSSGLPNTCPHCETNYSLKLLGETIALERTSLGFDPAAGAILEESSTVATQVSRI